MQKTSLDMAHARSGVGRNFQGIVSRQFLQTAAIDAQSKIPFRRTLVAQNTHFSAGRRVRFDSALSLKTYVRKKHERSITLFAPRTKTGCGNLGSGVAEFRGFVFLAEFQSKYTSRLDCWHLLARKPLMCQITTYPFIACKRLSDF